MSRPHVCTACGLMHTPNDEMELVAERRATSSAAPEGLRAGLLEEMDDIAPDLSPKRRAQVLDAILVRLASDKA